MKVLFSRDADADLADIRAYISVDTPRRAESFARELVNECLAIGDVPLGWPVVARYERRGLRRKAFRHYLIFYRIRLDTIEIVRILHGRRDVERLLFADGS